MRTRGAPFSADSCGYGKLPGKTATGYPHDVLRTIIIVLLVLWLLGFLLRAFGGLIHLLLIVVLVIVIYRLVTGRPVV